MLRQLHLMCHSLRWFASLVFAVGVCWPRLSEADPNALWRIIHEQCVPHQEQFHWPAPCAEVNLLGGYVVLKDIVGATQLLLMPTARVTGIEDPAILAPAAPNYWQAAWQARFLVQALADRALPDQDLSLAINSIDGRSQNQLHIHIDCIRADVRDALRAHAAAIGGTWAPFPIPLANHPYWAMRVETLDRPGANPFQLLAGEVPGASDNMGLHTLVAVGAPQVGHDPGLVLLETKADPAAANHGEGEELQDHSCAVARSP